MLELLGEETTRVLTSARDAAATSAPRPRQAAERIIAEATAQAAQTRSGASPRPTSAWPRSGPRARRSSPRPAASSSAAARRPRRPPSGSGPRRTAEAQALRDEAPAGARPRPRSRPPRSSRRPRTEGKRDGGRGPGRARAGAARPRRRRKKARQQIEQLNAGRERLLAGLRRRARAPSTRPPTSCTSSVADARLAAAAAARRVEAEPEPTLEELDEEVASRRASSTCRSSVVDGRPRRPTPEADARAAAARPGRRRAAEHGRARAAAAVGPEPPPAAAPEPPPAAAEPTVERRLRHPEPRTPRAGTDRRRARARPTSSRCPSRSPSPSAGRRGARAERGREPRGRAPRRPPAAERRARPPRSRVAEPSPSRRPRPEPEPAKAERGREPSSPACTPRPTSREPRTELDAEPAPTSAEAQPFEDRDRGHRADREGPGQAASSGRWPTSRTRCSTCCARAQARRASTTCSPTADDHAGRWAEPRRPTALAEAAAAGAAVGGRQRRGRRPTWPTSWPAALVAAAAGADRAQLRRPPTATSTTSPTGCGRSTGSGRTSGSPRPSRTTRPPPTPGACYDALPAGRQGALGRRPGPAGPCPDCDDNVLAGDHRQGRASSPPGNRCAPAHPGCRCLVLSRRDRADPPTGSLARHACSDRHAPPPRPGAPGAGPHAASSSAPWSCSSCSRRCGGSPASTPTTSGSTPSGRAERVRGACSAPRSPWPSSSRAPSSCCCG